MRIVEVPGGEFETMGPNVLGLPGGRALALAGNAETKQRLEAAGVEVLEYAGDHISRLGRRRTDLSHTPCRFCGGPFVVETSTHARRRRPCSTCS